VLSRQFAHGRTIGEWSASRRIFTICSSLNRLFFIAPPIRGTPSRGDLVKDRPDLLEIRSSCFSYVHAQSIFLTPNAHA